MVVGASALCLHAGGLFNPTPGKPDDTLAKDVGFPTRHPERAGRLVLLFQGRAPSRLRPPVCRDGVASEHTAFGWSFLFARPARWG
jgi:hypothetical protein